MAMDLRVTCTLKDNDLGLQLGPSSLTVATTGDTQELQRITTSTSEGSWTFSTQVGNAGYLFLASTSETDTINIGFATGVLPIRLKPRAVTTDKYGPPCLIMLDEAEADLFHQASANTPEFVAWLLED